MRARVEHAPPRKPLLLVFSPLPPVENGIADYCAELLPEFARSHDVLVVIENHAPPPRLPEAWPIIYLTEYLHREDEFSSASYLYHLGNNRDHGYLLPVLLRHPGIVVLHDISLHHLIDQLTLRHGDVDGYCELLEREYGNPGRLLADQFRTHRLREQAMFYEMPMIRLIASRCKAIVVHSRYAQTKVLAQEPDVPVAVVRHHLAPSAIAAARSITRNEARDLLGVDHDELLFVSLGFITKAKQIDTVLEVLARCRKQLPRFRYILAGQAQAEHYDVKAAIQAYGLADVVEVTGYLKEEDFYAYSIAADIVINLRYPSAGETSGTLVRTLGVGACVMVVDIGPFAELPDDVCVKLPWSKDFDITLMRALLTLVAQPQARHLIGVAAKAHVQTHHALSESGARYRHVIDRFGARSVLPWQARQSFEYATPAAREDILARLKSSELKRLPLWFREMQFPLAAPGEKRRVVVFGTPRSKQLLCSHLGYDADSVTLMPAAYSKGAGIPSQRRAFGLALVEPNDFPPPKVWHEWLSGLNRILELDGMVLVSANGTWPKADSSLREQLTQHLRQTGFRLLRYLASPPDISVALDIQSTAGGPKDEAIYYYPCWLATKVSEFIEPAMTLAQTEQSEASA